MMTIDSGSVFGCGGGRGFHGGADLVDLLRGVVAVDPKFVGAVFGGPDAFLKPGDHRGQCREPAVNGGVLGLGFLPDVEPCKPVDAGRDAFGRKRHLGGLGQAAGFSNVRAVDLDLEDSVIRFLDDDLVAAPFADDGCANIRQTRVAADGALGRGFRRRCFIGRRCGVCVVDDRCGRLDFDGGRLRGCARFNGVGLRRPAGHDRLAPDADLLSPVLSDRLRIAHLELLACGAAPGPSRRGSPALLACLGPNALGVAPGDDRSVCQPDVVPVLGESLSREVVWGRVPADDLACVPAGAARAFVVPDPDLVVERFCFLRVHRNLLSFQGFVPQPKDMFALSGREVKPIDAFCFNKLRALDWIRLAQIWITLTKSPTATVRARGVVRGGCVGFAIPANKTARIAAVTTRNHKQISKDFRISRGANLQSRKALIPFTNGGARCR